MTNEEKAIEYSQIQIADTVTERRIKEAYLNACEWKDQQFKEYLEKKRAKEADAYSENMNDFKAGGLHMVFEIINELFGE